MKCIKKETKNGLFLLSTICLYNSKRKIKFEGMSAAQSRCGQSDVPRGGQHGGPRGRRGQHGQHAAAGKPVRPVGVDVLTVVLSNEETLLVHSVCLLAEGHVLGDTDLHGGGVGQLALDTNEAPLVDVIADIPPDDSAGLLGDGEGTVEAVVAVNNLPNGHGDLIAQQLMVSAVQCNQHTFTSHFTVKKL